MDIVGIVKESGSMITKFKHSDKVYGVIPIIFKKPGISIRLSPDRAFRI